MCPQGEDRDKAPYERIEGIEIHRFPLAPAEGGALGYLREYAQALWRTARWCDISSGSGRFDVVHASNPPDLLLLADCR